MPDPYGSDSTDPDEVNDLIRAGKNDASLELAGDTTSQVPLGATAIATVALAPGANATDAQPFGMSTEEGY